MMFALTGEGTATRAVAKCDVCQRTEPIDRELLKGWCAIDIRFVMDDDVIIYNGEACNTCVDKVGQVLWAGGTL